MLRLARSLSSQATAKPIKVSVLGAAGPLGAAVLSKLAQHLDAANIAVAGDLPQGAPKNAKAAPLADAIQNANIALILSGDAAAAGKALAKAAPDVQVSVVGNTAALKAAKASGLKMEQFASITRDAQVQGEAMLSAKAKGSIANVVAWGEGTVDVSHATVDGAWALPHVGGEAIVKPAELSVDAKAEAIVAHVMDWYKGSGDKWVSMGVPATGDFGLGEGIFYSVPVVCSAKGYKRVGGLALSPEVAAAMEASRAKLAAEAAGL